MKEIWDDKEFPKQFCLVGNKSDLTSWVSQDRAATEAWKLNAYSTQISAKTGSGVDNFFDSIEKHTEKMAKYHETDMIKKCKFQAICD